MLIGGGEFSFGETEEADEAWLARIALNSDGGEVEAAEGTAAADDAVVAHRSTIGFVPAASGSADYGQHLAVYFDEFFGQAVETVPVYRDRDARRGRNIKRLAEVDAVYLGGGVADHLLEGLRGTPCGEALETRLREGGMVVVIAAAAQAAGVVVRALRGREHLKGFGWLDGGVVETNFVPKQDRRLRRLLRHPAAHWGLGIPAGSAILLGPDGVVETVGPSYRLNGPNASLTPLGAANDSAPVASDTVNDTVATDSLTLDDVEADSSIPS